MSITIGGGEFNVGHAYLAELAQQRALQLQLLQMQNQRGESQDRALASAGQAKAQIDAARLQVQMQGQQHAAQLQQAAQFHGDDVAHQQAALDQQDRLRGDSLAERQQQYQDTNANRAAIATQQAQARQDAIGAQNQARAAAVADREATWQHQKELSREQHRTELESRHRADAIKQGLDPDAYVKAVMPPQINSPVSPDSSHPDPDSADFGDKSAVLNQVAQGAAADNDPTSKDSDYDWEGNVPKTPALPPPDTKPEEDYFESMATPEQRDFDKTPPVEFDDDHNTPVASPVDNAPQEDYFAKQSADLQTQRDQDNDLKNDDSFDFEHNTTTAAPADKAFADSSLGLPSDKPIDPSTGVDSDATASPAPPAPSLTPKAPAIDPNAPLWQQIAAKKAKDAGRKDDQQTRLQSAADLEREKLDLAIQKHQDDVDTRKATIGTKQRMIQSALSTTKKVAMSNQNPDDVIDAYQARALGHLPVDAENNPVLKAELDKMSASEAARAKANPSATNFVPRAPEDIWASRYKPTAHSNEMADALEQLRGTISPAKQIQVAAPAIPAPTEKTTDAAPGAAKTRISGTTRVVDGKTQTWNGKVWVE